tara:strand:+ start:172 stop:519 length:348 start_codon:yes stop_codon:yes gene_type:complete
MRFTAKIENGKINWHDTDGLARYLYEAEGECYIDIKPSKIRNTAQNNYYWSILREFARQVGYQPEELHYWCKHHFKVETTTDYTKEEFSEFIDRVILWAAEQGYPVKDPRSTRLP